MTRKSENQKASRSGSRKRVGSALFRNTVAWNAVLLSALVGMFVGYLMMNDSAAAKGFQIKANEQHIADLQDESRHLDLRVVQLKSMGNIEAKVQALGLVPVGHVEYVGTETGAVAMK